MRKGHFVSLKYVQANAVIMRYGHSHSHGRPLESHSPKVIMTLEIEGTHVEFNISTALKYLTLREHIFPKFVDELAEKLEGRVFDISSKMEIMNFKDVINECLDST